LKIIACDYNELIDILLKYLSLLPIVVFLTRSTILTSLPLFNCQTNNGNHMRKTVYLATKENNNDEHTKHDTVPS